jgi:hypothetical protein
MVLLGQRSAFGHVSDKTILSNVENAGSSGLQSVFLFSLLLLFAHMQVFHSPVNWPFDLSSFPNLETVVIPEFSSRLGNEIHEKFFGAITSPHFKHLVLFPEQDPEPAMVGSAESPAPNPWADIDEGVARFRHPLDILIYSIQKSHHDLEPLRVDLEEMLPLCWARGLVHIHLHGERIWGRLHVYHDGSEDW